MLCVARYDPGAALESVRRQLAGRVRAGLLGEEAAADAAAAYERALGGYTYLEGGP
jgi:hypothetical protein